MQSLECCKDYPDLTGSAIPDAWSSACAEAELLADVRAERLRGISLRDEVDGGESSEALPPVHGDSDGVKLYAVLFHTLLNSIQAPVLLTASYFGSV